MQDLFTRIAPVTTVSLRYDRAGRSDGTAFVTYPNVSDARSAIREFDGANAKGQPIRLTLLPLGPSGGRSGGFERRNNPFDRVENPRSLFARVEVPKGRGGGRRRSDSPEVESADEHTRDGSGRGSRRGGAPLRDRRSDVSRPAPDNIDRYVPGQTRALSPGRRGAGRDGGRMPGERRDRGGRVGGERRGGDRDGVENGEPRMVNGRPRKTQEELDAEMEDYWGSAASAAAGSDAARATTAAAPAVMQKTTAADDDIDMIE